VENVGQRGTDDIREQEEDHLGEKLTDAMLPEFGHSTALMPRLVWLAIFCLAALGCLTVVRSIVRPGAAAGSAPSSLPADVLDIDTPSAKGDRLPSRSIDFNALRQAGLDALKKAAAPTTISKPEAAADDVVSWHWREGSRVVRRRQSQ
jgi:hypothetical protein